MDTRNTNRANMIRTTILYCIENPAPTSTIVAFGPVLLAAQNKVTLIDQLDQIAMSISKGVTLDTNKIRQAMSSVALKCANAVYGYASAAKNNTLKALVDYKPSALDHLPKEKVDDACQTIHDAAVANMLNAQNYGITAGDTSDLQTAVDLYRMSIQSPRQFIITRSNANKQIGKLIREIIDDLFDGQMDSMVRTLISSNPEHVDKYFLVRQIIQLGTTTGKIRGTVFDKENNPLAGTLIFLRITGEQTIIAQTKVDTTGNFNMANIKPGNYDIEVSLAGYITITETDVRFGPGKELKRKYTLLKGAAPHAGSDKLATVSGKIGDAHGNMLAGVTCVLISEGKTYTVITGDDGYYLFEGVIDGTYTLQVMLFGKKLISFENVVLKTNDSLVKDLMMEDEAGNETATKLK
jgi:hypothetical protein